MFLVNEHCTSQIEDQMRSKKFTICFNKFLSSGTKKNRMLKYLVFDNDLNSAFKKEYENLLELFLIKLTKRAGSTTNHNIVIMVTYRKVL